MLHNLFYIQWMNDCLVVYIKRDVTCIIDNDIIMHWFQIIWKFVKDNCKLYVFTFFFFIIIVVVNIWISLFIKLYEKNLWSTHWTKILVKNYLKFCRVVCHAISAEDLIPLKNWCSAVSQALWAQTLHIKVGTHIFIRGLRWVGWFQGENHMSNIGWTHCHDHQATSFSWSRMPFSVGLFLFSFSLFGRLGGWKWME